MATTTAAICDRLIELHRQRQDLHRAEKSMTYRIKAVCRRLTKGDREAGEAIYRALEARESDPLADVASAVVEPYIGARDAIRASRTAVEDRMRTEVRGLRVWPYAHAIVGMGPILLASLVGETGNLADYPTVSKVWKRLGLAVVDGSRQRRVRGAEALLQRYSASRRSTVWVIGRSVLRNQSITKASPLRKFTTDATYYRRCYDSRKDYELSRGLTRGHAHNRAARYMEKKLVRDIWRAWRECALNP